MSDVAAGAPGPKAAGASRLAGVVERCAVTGMTKPECHCPACLAALVADHGRRPSSRAEQG